jgi:hypothetical protein
MLKGFHYPLTPKGKSTLNPPTPWHYSSDFLMVEFWADPAAIAALLPDGLDAEPTARAGAVKDLSALGGRPVVNLLHQPRLAAGSKAAIHELVENVPHDLKIDQAWIGNGTLTFPVARGEEISDLAPVRCGRGVRASMA